MKSLYIYAPRPCSLYAWPALRLVTGRWTGNFSTADNGLEIVVALNQAADGTITGYIVSPRCTDTITSGKIEGGKVTLEAERAGRGGGALQKVTYTAVVEGGKMKLTMPAQFRRQGDGRSRRPGRPARQVPAPARPPAAGRGPGPADPVVLAADAAVSRRSSNWRASPPMCPRRCRPVRPRSRCRCPPPRSSTTAWPRRRRWAGTAGTSSATR